jgi:hypothetical protein
MPAKKRTSVPDPKVPDQEFWKFDPTISDTALSWLIHIKQGINYVKAHTPAETLSEKQHNTAILNDCLGVLDGMITMSRYHVDVERTFREKLR